MRNSIQGDLVTKIRSDVKEEAKRNRLRNYVGTQWVSALERGGRDWPRPEGKKEELTKQEWKETLDPQTTEWFEDRLETLASQTFCRYLVYQVENPQDDGAHYQFYVEFNEPQDLLVVKSWLHRTTSLQRRFGPRTKARHYSMKGSCPKPQCNMKWDKHGDRECHEFGNEVLQIHREFGVWHSSGQRVDIENLIIKLDEHKSWVQVIRDPDISLEVAKYGKFAKEYFDAKKPKESKLKFNDWQKEMVAELIKEPNDRTIIWIYDPVGGLGKTTLAKYLVRNHDAIVVSGSKQDILHAYDNQRIVIFDYTRSQEGYISYSAMEEIKNGCYFVSKYNSRMVVRDDECHVVVFANWVPNFDKLSKDRWDFRPLSTLP